MYEILDDLIETPSVSGDEGCMSSYLEGFLIDYKPKVDGLGNVVIELGKVNPRSPLLMIDLHIDTVGYVVRKIDKDELKVIPRGWVDPRSIVGRPMEIYSGNYVYNGATSMKSLIKQSSEQRGKTPLWNDISVFTEDHSNIKIGDTLIPKVPFQIGEKYITGYGLDNKAAISAVLSALCTDLTPKIPIVIAFTTQEEVGCRGLRSLVRKYNPTLGLTIDVTPANDTSLDSGSQVISNLNGGLSLKIQDKSTIYDKSFSKRLNGLFGCRQYELNEEISTQSYIYYESNRGCRIGGISVPIRNMHMPQEVVSKSSLTDLRNGFINFINDFDGKNL